jgi:uncharacterized integral membrane protein (TIGR02327 family)
MLQTTFGLDAILRVVSHFLFIYLAFWALQSVRADQFFKKGEKFNRQIRFVYLFLSIALGYTVSCFVLEFLMLSRNIL